MTNPAVFTFCREVYRYFPGLSESLRVTFWQPCAASHPAAESASLPTNPITPSIKWADHNIAHSKRQQLI
jgi:hypothetical protein